MKVVLAWPWTGPDGARHSQGDVLDVDRATRNNLVFAGLARDAKEAKPLPVPPADGKVK